MVTGGISRNLFIFIFFNILKNSYLVTIKFVCRAEFWVAFFFFPLPTNKALKGHGLILNTA